MKLLFQTVLLIILANFHSFGQISKDSLESKIINADKIEIVSHEDLFVLFKYKSEKYKNNYLKYRKDYLKYEKNCCRTIVENGKPNKSIIKERIKLDQKAIKELLLVLNNQKDKDSSAQPHSCFEPHHAVLIYKNGNCSYLDICFGCLVYAVSEDIIVGENFMIAEEDWKNLELFFKNRGVKYKMPKEKTN